jgi:hypothetical protein
MQFEPKLFRQCVGKARFIVQRERKIAIQLPLEWCASLVPDVRHIALLARDLDLRMSRQVPLFRQKVDGASQRSQPE